MLTSMRGGFKSAVKSASGGGGGGGQSSASKRWVWNLLTVALLVAALVLLGRRFGLFSP